MREITCEELKLNLKDYTIIDVRTPEEYVGELGHIAEAKLITLGPELEAFLKTQSRDLKIAFVCRSGARSGQTTILSEEMGYKQTFNVLGGMIRWNELRFPKER